MYLESALWEIVEEQAVFEPITKIKCWRLRTISAHERCSPQLWLKSEQEGG